jgi:hypothetical protein
MQIDLCSFKFGDLRSCPACDDAYLAQRFGVTFLLISGLEGSRAKGLAVR